MRMMVTIRIPVEKGSRAIQDGKMAQVIHKTLEHLKPECAYFLVENGKRTMRAVYQTARAEEMVPAFEPAMMQLDAEVELTPCMTAEELKAALQAMS